MENNIIQSLLKFFKEITDSCMKVLADPEARKEYFRTLGLDVDENSQVDLSSLPDTTNLDKFISTQAKDIEDHQILTAIIDASAVIVFIEGIVRGIISGAEGETEKSVTEFTSVLLNLLTINFVRLRYPAFHSILTLAATVDNNVIGNGGYINLYGVVKRWFEGLSSGDIQSFSDYAFLLFAFNLTLIGYNLEEDGADAEIAWRYGWDGCNPNTPVAESIANRTLSWSLKLPGDLNKEFYNTLAFVPDEQGGFALITSISGALDKTFKFGKEKAFSVKIDSDATGIFRVGESSSGDWGDNNQFAVTYKHDRKKAPTWKLIKSPVLGFTIGTNMASFTLKPDAITGKVDLVIKLTATANIEYGRGDKSGFPFNFLPKKNANKKIPVSFGYSIRYFEEEEKYKGGFFFGDSPKAIPPALPPDTSDSIALNSVEEETKEPNKFLKVLAFIINHIDAKIPIHKDIGGLVGFENIYLKMETEDDFSETSTEVSLDFWIKFGKALSISISRLGVELQTSKRDDSGGMWGYDIKPKIKPPTGAGLRIDTSLLTGGGFLHLDDEKGEYFGAFELSFKNLFNVNAIGIINTKMPDGSDGFSLLVIITAEFSVQLGGGFVLLGVGGLLGLDRHADVEVLRLGLKDNSIKSVLFPENVAANVIRIISDLKQIFPIQEGTFLIGLMAKIAYGTPTLITIELGIILELPNPRVIILGVIKAILPKEDAPVLKLQVNFLGVIDFQNKFVYFEASLYDSTLASFPLTGSLALVAGWGDTGLFGISVGGFHPDFEDYPCVPTLPGAFRDMDRVSIQLLSGDNPRLGLECYFAITSNSVQFGAKAELLADGPMSYNLYGLLAFDALFLFDPFSFVINLQATLAIRKRKSVLFGIHFQGKLTGPSPWHVEGKVSFSLLFFDVTIRFSTTWGDPTPTIESVTEDLKLLLQKELSDKNNWQASLPVRSTLSIRLRKLSEEEEQQIIVYPFGGLSFSQRAIPLEYTLEKYGNRSPASENRFTIDSIKVGNKVYRDLADEKELFAEGHYKQLTEAQKLSRKSFEKMKSGKVVSDANKITSAKSDLDSVELDYELNYTYDDRVEKPSQSLVMSDLLLKRLRRSAAVSKSPLSWINKTGKQLNVPEKVSVTTGTYTIANVSDLTMVNEQLFFNTHSEAVQAYENIVQQDPEMALEMQVVESFELAF
ncbi:MAG: hypothetical protein ACI85O_000130 [Saprospiraceae bacterium]|jgi:hypothetical protein